MTLCIQCCAHDVKTIVFRDFTIETIEATYTASRTGADRKAKELLITGPKRRSSRR